MKKRYYEIRLESIGGLGANLCAKILGELGVSYLDANAISFSSYGSEKTGTPVKGHIRYSSKNVEIRAHSPVETPDILAIFHEALLQNPKTQSGCNENTSMIIATEKSEIRTINFVGKAYGIDAERIAIETKSRINMVMFGAIQKIMGIKDTKNGEELCKAMLSDKYPDMIENNISGIRRGFNEVKEIIVNNTKENTKEEVQEWGYDNAPIGGINPRIGNGVISDLSPSRQGYIPIFIKDKCINCGLCHTTCPDMVFQFRKGEFNGRTMMINMGLDYYHCKGCLRCVEICPVNALVRGYEAEHPQKDFFIPNQELLRNPEYYEKTGADGYITSESFLTEKRMEGGIV